MTLFPYTTLFRSGSFSDRWRHQKSICDDTFSDWGFSNRILISATGITFINRRNYYLRPVFRSQKAGSAVVKYGPHRYCVEFFFFLIDRPFRIRLHTCVYIPCCKIEWAFQLNNMEQIQNKIDRLFTFIILNKKWAVLFGKPLALIWTPLALIWTT